MTRVLSFLRSVTRPDRVLRGCLGLALLAIVWACADKVVGPSSVQPKGKIGVYADLGPTGVTTLVIQVSGPGIVKSDGSPDTLAFNVPLENGVASGSLDVPAGSDRVITARAFVGVTETHRGTVTTNILEGTNPTLHITLAPLVGNLPITVSIGSTIIIVQPSLATIAVGDTVTLTSQILDFNGSPVNAKVRWATLNPIKAAVDTNGLVTVKDTGVVQIVGTYGTVGGAAKITGVFAESVAEIHLTWNGSVDNKWTEVNNWTPHGLGAARVPALTDSVVIPAGVTNMPLLQCADDNAVRDIVIEEGASLGSTCGYPLNVYGSAVVKGPVPTVNARPNAKLAGSFGQLYIKGAGTTLIDSVVASYVQVEIPTGTFSLDHHTLRSTGDFYIADGTVTMVDGDTLIIAGNTTWSGDDHNGLLTGGVIIARGSSFYGPRYYGSGTSRLVLDRATGGTQLSGFDYINSPNNSQIRRLEIKTRDGADICGYVRVTDTLSLVSTGTPATLSSCSSYRIRALGPVITGTNTDVANYEWELMHVTGTSLVSGTWHPTITGFNVDDAAINPALAYGNVVFTAKNTVPGNMVITGYLYLNGATAELDLNGKKLTVGNYLETNDGGMLKMMNAADSLIVAEYGYFPDDFHGTQKPKLTAGVLTIGAYLYGFGFASAGTKLVMTGTSSSGSKYISGMNYESRPTQELYDLEYAGSTYGVCERTKVANIVVVKAGATVNETACGSGYLTVVGDLITEASSTLSPYMVMLNTAVGTSHVAGAYSPQHTDFNVNNAVVKPGLAYGNMRFFASAQLSGTTTATGYVYASGNGVDLAINGQKLFVGNYLQLDNNSTLTMTNAADSVTVANYGYFNSNTSAVQEAKLTAGVLSIGEYLYGFGFSASGTHKLVMAGTNTVSTQKYISGMNFESRPTQGVQNLEIAEGKSYGVCERIAVKGTLTLAAGATFDSGPCGSPYLRLDGDLVTAVTSTLAPYNVMLNSAFGTDNVNGSFSPTYTSIHSSAAAGHLKAGLGYQNVQFFAPHTLTGNLTVNGDLNINGAAAVVTLGGNQITVSGTLNVQSSATIVMNNAADVLDLSGVVNWNGGGSEAGKLTAGTAIFRGPNFCATNYETSGTHKTVFDRAITQVKLQCVSSSGVNQPMWNVEVKGAGVSLECYMNVTNDIHVFAGATLNETCGGGTLWVGHILTTDDGSAVTNGPSYPSSTKLAVVFEDPSGTQNVAGAYSADQSYFTALNAYIQPTVDNSIDYKYVRIDQSTQFVDSTEIDGSFDIINTALVSLNDNPVVVHGSMSLSTSARLKMVSAGDVLIVGLSNPSAALIWTGEDNINDGAGNLLLTNGTIYFHGNNFQGTDYHANAGTPHTFVFAGASTSGTVSAHGSPAFANLQISNARPVVTGGGTTTVHDAFTMDASRTFTGSGTVILNGAVATAAGSDYSGSGTTNVNGANGTSGVLGAFHPATTVFGAASPILAALKAGLSYNSVGITGPYQLNGPTTFANSSSITGSGALNMNGQTLNVAGSLDISSGGVLSMTNISDALNVSTLLHFQSNGGLSTLSAGTMTVGGGFTNSRSGLHATGLNTLVLNNSGPETISTSSGNQNLRNVTVSGSGTVTFSGGATITGDFSVSSATTIASGGTLNIDGTLTTVAGSALNPNHLDVSAAGGTNGVGGTLSISGTTTFSGGSQTIKAGTGISYTNLTVSSNATVSGGALSLPAASTLTVNSGGTLAVPDGSTMGIANVSGTLTFLGNSLSTNTLTVFAGGLVETTNHGASAFFDFGRIVLQNGGFMNNGDRSTCSGGFRYKLSGSPSGFSNSNGSGQSPPFGLFSSDPCGV